MSTATITREVLDTVQSFPQKQASERAIYAGEGVSLTATARRNRNSPQYQSQLLEATRLYAAVLAGDRRAALTFTEVMTRSDFSALFGDILDRQIYARYTSQPVQWDAIARRGRVRDFRTVKRYTLDGGEGRLQPVKELTEYPAAELDDGEYSYSVKKYGRRIGLSWEALVNDDLDAFGDIPARLANSARRTEEYFVTDLYAGASGPDSTFFANGNLNVINSTVLGGTVTANPALTVQALQYAFQVLGQQVDSDGGPIYIEGATLVVPPALEVAAMNIINATEIVTATGSGGSASEEQRSDRLTVQNWMRNRLRVIVNPWLPIISTTNGNTSWYLFANPGSGRPAMEIGFLIGHETPELFMKSPNAIRVGGGLASPEDGDFDTDSTEWKIRHVLGGTLIDPKMAVASNGTGS